MAKTYGAFELADGTIHENIRITLQDKLQHERTARLKKWDVEKENFRTTAFWVWHAAKRTGLIDMPYEEFEKTAVDASLANEDDDEVEEDLTRS